VNRKNWFQSLGHYLRPTNIVRRFHFLHARNFMAEIDTVFARFHDDHAVPQPQRKLLSIPRRGPSSGSRTVEVVHVRSGASPKGQDQRPRDSGVRAATWSEGFPSKPASNRPPVELSAPIQPPQPAVHVMPIWEPAHTDPEPTQPEAKRRGRPRKIASEPAPIAADPFDPNDDGTNCLRCGLLVQPAREKRGLMTCAKCG
jgi:hypothetical protein